MTRTISSSSMITAAMLALMAASPAMAHTGPGAHASGFDAGFVHPWLGLDHLLAMLAVGLLAVRAQSTRALWLVPAGFVSGMLIAAAAAYSAWPVAGAIPGVEIAITASVIVLGFALALLPRVTAAPAAGLVALAGLLHGNAHMMEISGAVASYATGMVVATALLHGAGVLIGLALTRGRGMPAVRVAGGALACGTAIAVLV